MSEHSKKHSRLSKVVVPGIAFLGVVLFLIIGYLVFFGIYGVDTKAVPGANVPRRHLETIQGLGLLSEGEKIQYFYSNAFFDVRRGMYFFTERKVVVYDEGLAEAPIVLTYNEIADITADFSDSFWEDGTIYIRRIDGSDISFPISPEGGRRFFESLVASWKRWIH